jgi:hypothetical protein
MRDRDIDERSRCADEVESWLTALAHESWCGADKAFPWLAILGSLLMRL